jgi:amino acid permease
MPGQNEPPEIGQIEFPMALRIAGIFKVVAVVTIVGTSLAVIAGAINLNQETDVLGNHVYSGAAIVAYVVGGLFGGVVVASFFAFFGYVLDILVKLYSETWELRIAMESDDEGE